MKQSCRKSLILPCGNFVLKKWRRGTLPSERECSVHVWRAGELEKLLDFSTWKEKQCGTQKDSDCCWFCCFADDPLRLAKQMGSRTMWPCKITAGCNTLDLICGWKRAWSKLPEIHGSALTDLKELCLRPCTTCLAPQHRQLGLLKPADPAGSALHIFLEGTQAVGLSSHPCPWHAHPCT